MNQVGKIVHTGCLQLVFIKLHGNFAPKMALTVSKARVAVLKALAHPTRLEIILILSQGTRCVSEIEKSVGGDMSTVSKHLSLMPKAGLIGSKKGGLHINYEIACGCLDGFLRCVDSLAGNRVLDDQLCC